MDSHLSDDALLEIIEAGQVHPHLAGCQACRSRSEGLREVLASVREADTDTPEPSPLFWDHFAARVGAAVRKEEAGGEQRRRWWNPSAVVARVDQARGWTGWWRAIAGVSIVLVVSFLLAGRTGRAPGRSSTPLSRAVAPQQDAARWTAEASESADASWNLVTQVSAGLDLDAAADEGFGLQPGSAERAAAQLTPGEQRVLVELLQAAAGEGDPPIAR